MTTFEMHTPRYQVLERPSKRIQGRYIRHRGGSNKCRVGVNVTSKSMVSSAIGIQSRKIVVSAINIDTILFMHMVKLMADGFTKTISLNTASVSHEYSSFCLFLEKSQHTQYGRFNKNKSSQEGHVLSPVEVYSAL